MEMCIDEEKANVRFDIPAIPSCNYCFFTVRDTNRPEPELYCLGARVLRSEEQDIPAGKYVLILSPQKLDRATYLRQMLSALYCRRVVKDEPWRFRGEQTTVYVTVGVAKSREEIYVLPLQEMGIPYQQIRSLLDALFEENDSDEKDIVPDHPLPRHGSGNRGPTRPTA